jgi:hypothetical protein
MSFRIPTLRITGPEAAYDMASLRFIPPIPTRRVFHIPLVVSTAKISVSDLKQSRANKATSRKNWWLSPVQSRSLGR